MSALEARSPRAAVAVAFAAIYLIWGSTYLAIRWGVESLPPFAMVGARFLLAGAPFYLVLRLSGHARPEPAHWRSAAVIGGLMMLGGNGLVTWSEQTVPSGVAALLVATVPLWMSLLDGLWLRRGTLTPRLGVGLLAGFAGVALLVGPTGGDVRAADPWGAAALLAASVMWSLGSLASRSLAVPRSPFLASSMQMIAGGALALVVATATGEWGRLDLAAATPRSLIALAYLAVFGSIVALSAYVWLLRVTSASAVSTYAFVNPVVAVVLGWAFAGEALGARVVAATLLIVGAVALIRWRRRPADSRAR